MSDIKKDGSMDLDPTGKSSELSDDQLADVTGGITIAGNVHWDYGRRKEKCSICHKTTYFKSVNARYTNESQSEGYAWWACEECGTVWRLKSGGFWHTLWYGFVGGDWSKEHWSSKDDARENDPLWRR